MATPITSAPRQYRWLAITLSLLLPSAMLARLGQDSNWDLANYHLYNAHAWVHGRDAIDIAPAQLQSWHNPLLDLPLYGLQQAGAHGALIGLWLALPMMLALYLLLRLPARLATPLGPAAMAFLGLLAISGAAAASATGSSFNDAFVAAGVLASLSLLLAVDGDEAGYGKTFAAGALAGATAGLKLTALPFCIGLAGALACLPPQRRAPARLAVLFAGGVLGVLLTYGGWAWHLWQDHGNPFFPYFNQIFRSPDAAAVAYADERFRAVSWTDAALAPLRLLHTSFRYSEVPLRDPRLLLGCALLPLLVAIRFRSPATAASTRWRPWLALAAFYFVPLALWILQSGVYRYTLPLEMLACLALACVLQALPARTGVPAMAVCLLLVNGQTTRPDWGRQRFRQPMVEIAMPALPSDALVVTGGMAPVAYAALALPDTVPLISIQNNFMQPGQCTGLQWQAERRIRAHAGSIFLLHAEDPSARSATELSAAIYGLRVAGPCSMVSSSLGRLQLCPVRRVARPPVCPPRKATPGLRSAAGSPGFGD